MTGAVLALGIGAVTASGCVWYLPALADLRAGADRPGSRRLAAAACVTGWATAAATALLLLLGVSARPLLAVAAAGAGTGIGLRVRAAVRRRREEREDAVCWTALHFAPPRREPRPQYASARAVAWGLALAVTAALLLARGRAHGVSTPLAVAAPAALVACALSAAALRAARGEGPARTPTRPHKDCFRPRGAVLLGIVGRRTTR
ncbi:hypothetical protein [Streptomyces thermolilacinus]|uniref:hypothetical protein n=1 Tax=Streptomyces thermolilacinus TaxID=285540 RepID=UPI0033E4ACF1